MKLKSWIVFMAGAAAVLGHGQVTQFDPRQLAGWQLSGAAALTDVQGPAFGLPAGAQLSREFSAGVVLVRDVSEIKLAETPAEWPILEVGPVAVAIYGDVTQAKLKVTWGDEARALAISPDGVLDLVVGFDAESGIAVLAVGDIVESFATGQVGAWPSVVLSAGETRAWQHRLVEFWHQLPAAVIGAKSSTRSLTDSAAKVRAWLDSFQDAAGKSTSGTGAQTSSSASGSVKAAAVESGAKFEVYTPPSVRVYVRPGPPITKEQWEARR